MPEFQENHETKPESVLKITFSFAEHNNPELGEIIGIFEKSQKNILFQENAFMNEASIDKYYEGIKKFTGKNRHTKAYTYVSLVEAGVKEPTDEQIEKEAKKLRIGNVVSPEVEENLYLFRILGQVDKNERLGVKVDVIFERGIKPEDYDRKKIINAMESNSPSKEDLEELARYIRDRDSIIIEQMEQIRKRAVEKHESTNLYVKLGTFHSELATRLPEQLLSCVENASSLTEGIIADIQEQWESDPGFKMLMKVQTKLLFGESVSSEEWEEYNRFNRQ